MEQSSISILDYITAIGSIATPIFVIILSGIGWVIANRYNKAREIEEKLRDDRINIYNIILEPYIFLLMKEEHFKKIPKYKNKSNIEVATNKILSLEYKQAGFQLSLIGSDEVVRAFNRLMQYQYSLENKPNLGSPESTKETLKYFGYFLLEIRKNIGNKSTKLKYYETLEYLVKDIKDIL